MSKEIAQNLTVGNESLRYLGQKAKGSTRTHLAARAASFFAKQGYYGTSTQAIAESCHIRKASLFHHYKTKEEIAIAAMEYVHSECVRYIFNQTNNETVDKKERLESFLQACEKFFTDHEYALLPILLGLELGGVHFFKKTIENYFNAWSDALTELLLPICTDIKAAQKLAEKSMAYIQGHIALARIKNNQQTLSNLTPALKQLWMQSDK